MNKLDIVIKSGAAHAYFFSSLLNGTYFGVAVCIYIYVKNINSYIFLSWSIDPKGCVPFFFSPQRKEVSYNVITGLFITKFWRGFSVVNTILFNFSYSTFLNYCLNLHMVNLYAGACYKNLSWICVGCCDWRSGQASSRYLSRFSLKL